MTSEPIRQSALRRLWSRMAAIYGHRWASAYGDTPEDAGGKLTVAGDTWQRGLVGVSEAQIGQGLNACIVSADPWPPSLPDFRALCLGIPTIGALRAELAPGARSVSPFARLVWQHIDAYHFRQATTERAERMVRDAYETARAHVMAGGAMPLEPVAVIPQADEPRPVPASPEKVRSVLDAVAAALADPPTDEQAAA